MAEAVAELPGCDPAAMERDLLEGASEPEASTDPWLARRTLTVGASEAAAAMIITGRRHPEDFPVWVQDEACIIRKAYRGKFIHIPRLISRKLGLTPPFRGNGVSNAGKDRERELFHKAKRLVCEGKPPHGLRFVDPDSMRWVPHSVPREWLPLVDRYAPLSATPDGYARDMVGGHVTLDTKCKVDEIASPGPHDVLQIQAQCSVMEAVGGALIVGQQWAAEWKSDVGVTAFWADRDDKVIGELREAAREVMQRVQALREEVANG